MQNNTKIEIKDLVVLYKVKEGDLTAVENVSFGIEANKVTGLIGESGCGKTTIVQALLNIMPSNGYITNGQIIYNGQDILKLSLEDQRKLRWKKIACVFQAAQNSLNPVLKIEEQFIDVFEDHDIKISKVEIGKKIKGNLNLVNLEPERVLKLYPHQLSGGMKQRVIIAMSLLLDPDVLILDEPTTALDLITQAYIVDLLKEIYEKSKMTMMMVSHDISNVAKLADRIAVMYAAQIIEVGTVDQIFYKPLHPYSKGLIDSTPSIIGELRNKKPIPGDPPSLLYPPPGCRFSPRCAYAKDRCFKEIPSFREIDNGHSVACHRWQMFEEDKQLEVKTNG